MILADKIIEERKRNGWSQEELAEKLGVSRQAVSKWESAGSVPDLQRVIQLSELFGVSTDYLLKDEMVSTEETMIPYDGGREEKTFRKVSLEEANEFLEMKKKHAPFFANATALCILSPTVVVVLGALSEESRFHVTEGMAAGVGCTALFLMIAAAVFMFITCGIREGHSEHLEKEYFETEYGVSGMVKEKKRGYEGVFASGIALGVVLCIASVIPMIIAGAMEAPDYICSILAAVFLCMIALGVNLMIRVGIVRSSYDVLLQEGEFTRSEKHARKKMDTVSGIYWCLVTAIYLGWSFWTMRWDITWIVWPIAGVLCAVISGIMKLILGAGK